VAIKVKTNGEESHVVTKEGLKAAGIDPRDTDPRLLKIREFASFLEWLREGGHVDLSVYHESDIFQLASDFVDRDKLK
jgi:hypothetical protein